MEHPPSFSPGAPEIAKIAGVEFPTGGRGVWPPDPLPQGIEKPPQGGRFFHPLSTASLSQQSGSVVPTAIWWCIRGSFFVSLRPHHRMHSSTSRITMAFFRAVSFRAG